MLAVTHHQKFAAVGGTCALARTFRCYERNLMNVASCKHVARPQHLAADKTRI
jgi:hypothetical protein